MVDPAYMERFTSACFLPHTDLSRFLRNGAAARHCRSSEKELTYHDADICRGRQGWDRKDDALGVAGPRLAREGSADTCGGRRPELDLAEALGVPGPSLGRDPRTRLQSGRLAARGIGRVRAVEDEIQRAITEADGFDLLTMGRPEGPRCYCAVNNLLRKSLDDLARNYAAVVLDNEAGMEHLSRRTTNDVD